MATNDQLLDTEQTEPEVLRDMFLGNPDRKQVGDTRYITHGVTRRWLFGGMDSDEVMELSRHTIGPLIMRLREIVCTATEGVLSTSVEIKDLEHSLSAPKNIKDPADLREALRSIDAGKNGRATIRYGTREHLGKKIRLFEKDTTSQNPD